MTETEGVIKFEMSFEQQTLHGPDISELTVWREILTRLGLVGQDPARYDGLGFGNLSKRSSRGFLITGSQTGHLDRPGPEGYAEVLDWSLDENRILARGLVKPSSESLTHAAVYDLSEQVQTVFHVHSPQIWRAVRQRSAGGDAPASPRNVDVLIIDDVDVPNPGRENMDVPETNSGVAYGTPEMAREVRRVCRGRALPAAFIMGGHEDGVVCYGRNAMETGLLTVRLLAQSLTIV